MEGKVVLVAGAGATDPDGIGNGRAAAILMAEAGARIMCVDRDPALAARTVEMIAERGGEAEALGADITRNEDCAAMVAATLERFGRLDGLDNNVGISSRGSVVEETEEAWERVMEVNVKAMFLAAKHAIPAMIATAGGGAVVNVSSISALRPRGLTAYSASKGAVIALTRAMAVDHGGEGVRVNCIAPGPVYTPMVYRRGPGMSETARRARADASLLKTEGTGWDIGEAVRFLLSDRSKWITGHTLVVDGGASVRGPGKGYRLMARIPLLEETDLAPEDRDVLARPINLNKALAHSPEGARAFGGLGSWIRWQCKLDPRLRELAILQVGCLAKSEYEYSHHIRIGKDFGLDDGDIRAVQAETRGEPGGLGPVETAVLKGAREMTEGPAMSEETFAFLERELGTARTVDLVLVVAFYCGVVRLLETLEVDVEPDYQPWLDAFPLD